MPEPRRDQIRDQSKNEHAGSNVIRVPADQPQQAAAQQDDPKQGRPGSILCAKKQKQEHKQRHRVAHQMRDATMQKRGNEDPN